jgi:hypothetical protein
MQLGRPSLHFCQNHPAKKFRPPFCPTKKPLSIRRQFRSRIRPLPTPQNAAVTLTAANDLAVRNEAAGIEFIDENGRGAGLRFRERARKKQK